MTKSLFSLACHHVVGHRFTAIPFAGNAHLMRDIGCAPYDTPRIAFFHALPPR